MPKNLCCLCASDEGVFLDIFTSGDKTLRESLEICLSIKVDKYNILSTKICHKCAYELDQCSRFIQKCKKSRFLAGHVDKFEYKNRCNLCAEPGVKGYIFHLAKDLHSLNFSLAELHECFKDNIVRRDVKSLEICLTCRYNVDMLYDLKSIFEGATVKLKQIIDKKAILSELPKTETFVVNRKTTFIRPAKLELSTPSDSDSDTNTMTRKGASRTNKLSNNKTRVKPQLRTCDECQITIENGVDMYRFHRTGLTVCKSCWITMDPLRSASKKRKKQNSTGVGDTKLCTVFLKDVLTNASFKDERIYRIEKDEQGNTMFIVTDDSSEGEDKVSKSSAQNKKIRGDTVSSKMEVAETKRMQGRLKRVVKEDGTDNEKKSYKKLKYNLRQPDIKVDETSTAAQAPQTMAKTESLELSQKPEIVSQKRKKTSSNQSSDSDVSIEKNKKDGTSQAKTGARKQAKIVSESAVDSEDKGLSIKFSGKSGEIRKTDALKSNNRNSISSDDNAKNKDTQKSFPLVAEDSVRDSDSVKEDLIGTRKRSSSVSSKESSPVAFKSPSQRKSKTSSLANSKLKANKAYVCKVCGTSYRNKLMIMTHELSHGKQLEVKLCRMKVPDTDAATKQKKSCSLDRSETEEQQLSEGETIVNTQLVGEECKDSLEEKLKTLDSPTEENNENERPGSSLSTKNDLEKEINGHPDDSLPSKERLVDIESPNKTTTDDEKNVDDNDLHSNTAELVSKVSSPKEKDVSIDSTVNVKTEVSTVTRFDFNTDDNDKTLKESVKVEASEESNKVEEIVVASSPIDKLENNSNIISIVDHSEIEEKDGELESETDIKIVDTGSSENSVEHDALTHREDTLEGANVEVKLSSEEQEKAQKDETVEGKEEKQLIEIEEQLIKENVIETFEDRLLDGKLLCNKDAITSETTELISEIESLENIIAVCQESRTNETEDTSVCTATEILQEVFDLATTEVQIRLKDNVDTDVENTRNIIPETVENISKEINSADMPSLDPIIDETETNSQTQEPDGDA